MSNPIEHHHLLESVDVILSTGDFSSLESQRICVKNMLRDFLGDDAILHHRFDGAPFLSIPGLNISISHCRKAVAIALSNKRKVGIDVEIWREQLVKVAPRFLQKNELNEMSSKTTLLRDWTYKEAVFKLLQNHPSSPKTIMDISLNMPEVAAATSHLNEVTLTVASFSS